MTRFYTLLTAVAIAGSVSATASGKVSEALLPHSHVQVLDATRAGFSLTPLNAPMPAATLKADDASSEWRSLGMAVYTDAYLTSIQEPEPNTWEVEVQESTATPGLFKLVKPYAHIAPDGNCNDLLINARNSDYVYVPTQDLGFDPGNGKGNLTIGSMGGYFIEMGASPGDVVASYGDVFGTYDGHLISFPEGSLFYQQGGGMTVCNMDGRFRVTMPEDTPPAMSATTYIMLADQCAVEGALRVGVSTEGTFAKLLLYVSPGRFTYSENLYSLIASLAVQGQGREIEAEQMYSMTVTDPMTAGTAFAVAVDAGGEYIEGSGSAVTFFVTSDNAANWAPVEGTGRMGEDLIASVYRDVEPSSFDITVERNLTDANLVRVVNPYRTEQWPYYAGALFCEHNHYLYLDLTDPAKVRLPESALGVAGDGLIYVCDRVEYAEKNGEAPEQWYGSFNAESGEITFPAEGIIYRELNDPETYTANRNGLFKITIPVPDALDRIETDADAPAVYYNLQGMRVDRPEPGTLCIRRQGSVTEKVIIP